MRSARRAAWPLAGWTVVALLAAPGSATADLIMLPDGGFVDDDGGIIDVDAGVAGGSRLGEAVTRAGDFDRDGLLDVVAGASAESASTGSLWLYQGAPGGKLQAPVKLATGTKPGDSLGKSLTGGCDFDGDGAPDVAAGAPGADQVVVLFGGEDLAQLRTATLTFAQAGAGFGTSVACSPDINGDGRDDLAVGAPTSSAGSLTRAGALLVYSFSRTGMPLDNPLSFAGETTGELLGTSVAALGDVTGDGLGELVAGAPGFIGGSNFVNGRVVLIGVEDGALERRDEARENRSQAAGFSSPQFGASVAALGDVDGDGRPELAVGAPGYRGGVGAVYTFRLVDGELREFAVLEPSNAVSSGDIGTSVAGPGDLNGDGFADLLAGAPGWLEGGVQAGAVLVYLGGPAGFRQPQPVSSSLSGAVDFGWSVAGVGDLGDDGFADWAVGDPLAVIAQIPGPMVAGSVSLLPGGTRGPGGAFVSVQLDAGIPAAVASAGDVNGDGLSDLVLGFPAGGAGTGGALVTLASLDGEAKSFVLTVPAAGGRFAATVASAGDVDGDGYADVLVGAPDYSTPDAANRGAAFLFSGGAQGPALAPSFRALGPSADAHLGVSVSSAGDVDGDGFDDVALGAPTSGSGGAVVIYFGGPNGLGGRAPWVIEAPAAGLFFGNAVAAAGDTNGDGLGDVVIAAPGANGAGVLGRVFIAFGRRDGTQPVMRELGGEAMEEMGLGGAVCGAGDLDGDGLGDVVATATPPNEPGTLRVIAYFGAVVGAQPRGRWVDQAVMTGATGMVPAEVSAAGDVDGDGVDDFVLGSTALPGGAQLYLGRRGATPVRHSWAAQSLPAMDRLGESIAGVGDVNGDGFGDLVVSAPGARLLRFHLGGDVLPGRPWGLTQRFDAAPRGRGYRAREGATLAFAADLRDELAATRPVRLEVEVKRLDKPFDGRGTFFSPPSPSGVAVASLPVSLPPGRYHWRARVVSAGLAGRWRAFGANGEGHADFSLAVATVLPDAGMPVEPMDGGSDAGTGPVDPADPDLAFYTAGCSCTGVPGVSLVALALALVLARSRRRRRNEGAP